MVNLESLEAYNYELPENLIALEPVSPRDSSRLLVVDRARGKWEHKSFRDLPQYLDSNDLIVANNTKVLKARLIGHRETPSGELAGKVEFVLLEEIRPRVWEGMIKASAKYKKGFRFQTPTPSGVPLRAELLRASIDSPHGTVVAEFDRDPVESGAGELPIPHYLHRAAEKRDDQDYQTTFAKTLGSAAAPTAGLHFTPELISRLREKGVSWNEITLHVGLGTFRPVKEEDVRNHLMHEERYEISSEIARVVNSAKAEKRRVVAVGTTSVRTLESAWREGAVQPGWGRTSLFIRPGAFEFHVVDRMITNFHLPKSTLLMLVCTFAGRELALAAYAEAVKEKYRFFSYGDAMLIL